MTPVPLTFQGHFQDFSFSGGNALAIMTNGKCWSKAPTRRESIDLV